MNTISHYMLELHVELTCNAQVRVGTSQKETNTLTFSSVELTKS